jgi:hypothetical protein
MKLKVTVNGIPYDIDVEVEEPDVQLGTIVIGGTGSSPVVPTTASISGASANAVTAPLAGSVARVLVEEGPDPGGEGHAGPSRRGPGRTGLTESNWTEPVEVG